MTIGLFIEKALLAGKSAKETLALTRQVFKGCDTTMKSIYFYSSKLRREGKFKGLATGAQADPKALTAALKALEPVRKAA
jgi:hypothetical protein